jgi:hypothetical protein
MITYVNKYERGVLETTAPMDDSDAFPIGNTAKDFENGKWVALNEEQQKFKDENPDLTIAEIFYTKRMHVHQAIERKIEDIMKYDASKEVCEFVLEVGDERLSIWYDSLQRSVFMTSILAAEFREEDSVEVEIGAGFVTLPLAKAKSILAKMHGYADKAYNCTLKHVEVVKSLTSVEEVTYYNHKTGYPEKVEARIEV